MEPQRGGNTHGHSVAFSRSITRRVMGNSTPTTTGMSTHGGAIMRMVDEAAVIVAVRHAHHPVVTARVERFDFLKPAYIGDVVTVDCTMNYALRREGDHARSSFTAVEMDVAFSLKG